MDVEFEVIARNAHRTRFFVLLDGTACGVLTVTNSIFTKLIEWFRRGQRENGFRVTGLENPGDLT